MINILIYILFVLFSLGQLGRVVLLNGQINFYVFEILMVMLFPILLYNLGHYPLAATYKKYKIFLGFYLSLLASYLVGIFAFGLIENAVAALYFLRLVFYPAFTLYLFAYAAKNKTAEVLKRGFNISLILLAISSLIQYFLYPDLRNLLYLGWDPHLNRLFGVFFDTGLAAAFYGMISLYFFKKKNLIVGLAFMVFMIMTFSRSAYLFFLFVLVLDLFRNRKFKSLFIIVSVFLIVFSLLPKQFGVGVGLNRVFSVSSRAADYGLAFDLASKAPILGYGYNRIRFIRGQDFVEKNSIPQNSASSFSSSYLIILVTGGILGLLLFVVSLYKIAALINFQPYFIFILLMSFADNILLHPFIMFGLGSLIAISLLSYKSR